MAERILLINHYAGSPAHGMEFRPFYFARHWARGGHDVHVFAASFSHLRSRNPDGVRLLRREVLDGVTYHWFRTPRYQGNGVGRIVNMMVFLLWLLASLPVILAWKRFSVVIASSTYPLDMVPAWTLSRLQRARLVFEVHDLWPLSPMELGGFSPLHPFILLMQWGENFAYRRCDACVSLLPKALDHMLGHGLQRRKYLHIPNGVDLGEWESLQEELGPEHVRALDELRGRHGFVLGYVGGHGLSNALDTLVEAVAGAGSLSFGVAMIGAGPCKETLARKARELGIGDRMVFLPPIPKRQVPKALSAMDALYIGWQRTALYRFGISPNKLFDYMMSGKPILHAIEAGNDPVAEAACGVSVEPESPRALLDGLEFILHLSPEARGSMGARGREFVLQRHVVAHLADRMLKAVTTPRT
jgi:glycosyltransferase involved in cell wall biosynthesis